MKTRNLNLRTEFMNLVGSISVVELITNENAVKLIEEIYEELTNTTKENRWTSRKYRLQQIKIYGIPS